jgi:hypothetical protein
VSALVRPGVDPSRVTLVTLLDHASPRADWGLHGGDWRGGMSPWSAAHPGNEEGAAIMRTTHPRRVRLAGLFATWAALTLTITVAGGAAG